MLPNKIQMQCLAAAQLRPDVHVANPCHCVLADDNAAAAQLGNFICCLQSSQSASGNCPLCRGPLTVQGLLLRSALAPPRAAARNFDLKLYR